MFLERLGALASEGLSPEVYLDGVHLDRAAPEELAVVRAGVDKHGMRLTVHGPYMDAHPGGPDDDERKATARKLARAFDALEVLVPEIVVLHGGYERKRFGGDEDLWLENSLLTWGPLVERAEAMGVTIAVENIYERGPWPLRRLVDTVASERFRVCVDTGHLNVYSKADPAEWLEVLGDHVAEVHLHDNHGRRDEHLPPGDGTFDFRGFLAFLERHSPGAVLTLEQHDEAAVRKALRSLAALMDEARGMKAEE